MLTASSVLVPYIPFACSLSFRPAPAGQVQASPVRIHPGFTPRWFAQHMELDYGPAWHVDPIARRQAMVDMARTLNRVFPRLQLGGEPDAIIGSLSQAHTCCLPAALFGQAIEYGPDVWPLNHGQPLSDEQVDALQPPDVANHPLVVQLLEQMDVIERAWGVIEGELNHQGVLNTAFRLRGERIFMDMLDAPDRADHLFDVVTRTMLSLRKLIYDRQAASGAPRDWFVTANCTVNMISADLYERFIFPRDQRLAEGVERFGVHNCAWRVDPYAAAYARHDRLAYLDFGVDSDLPRLAELFPDTMLCAMIPPVDVATRPEAELRRMLERLRDAMPVCRIILADLEAGLPDQRVERVFDLTADIWGVDAASLVPEPAPW